MEVVIIFVGAITVVFLVRIVRQVAPSHYFEIHELIHGMNNAVTWQGIGLRFSFPFVVALVAALTIRESPLLVGAGVGFLGSLLLIWPTLLDQRLLPYHVFHRKPDIYLVYGMFVASFTLLALSGGYIASFLEKPVESLLSGKSAGAVLDATTARVDDIVVGLVVLGLGTLITWAFRRYYNRVQENGG